MSRQLFQYNPTTGYLFIPGLKARVLHEGGGYLVRTNQAGFRCKHEFSARKQSGAFRVLLFGDSYTAGDGVREDARYGDRLEQLLPGTEVFNFGLPGSGTDQQYLIWRELGKETEHDLVVIAVLVENIRRVAARYRRVRNVDGRQFIMAKPYFTLEQDGSLALHNVPVPKVPRPVEALPGNEKPYVDRGGRYEWARQAVRRMGPGIKEIVQRVTRYQPLPAYDRPEDPDWALLKALLLRWIDETPVPVVIFPIPLYHYVEGTASAASYQARFLELEDPPRVTVHDPLPNMRRFSVSERRSFRFECDCHPTPRGHQVLAESLARHIERWTTGSAARTSSEPGKRALSLNGAKRNAKSATVLGISGFYHDAAAAIVRDGEIVAAAQEERFSRVKHDPRFPRHAINYCLEEASAEPEDLNLVVFYDNPLLSFDRVIKSLLTVAPSGVQQWLKAGPSFLGVRLFVSDYVKRLLQADIPVLFTRHHLSHAASTFYPSPFERAAVLTMDGVGEWATTSIARGDGERIEVLKEIHYPHSLGLLYSALTYFCGFKVNSGEYKLMGLAPYGKPIYVDRIREKLIHFKSDGSFRLNMSHFGYLDSNLMTNARFEHLFDGPPREPESRITRREMDIAASIQRVIEDAVLGLARHAREVTGDSNLCLAGGVALNCVANGKLLLEGLFDRIWIQPAAGDAGGAIGAALLAYHRHLGMARRVRVDGRDRQGASYLGPAYGCVEVRAFLDRHGYPYEVVGTRQDRAGRIAKALSEEKVVGFFSGRMEFGPRALGARSILGDPRSPETQVLMNLKVKRRESFRPFAPSVLEERCSEYFDLDRESPYMLFVAPVRKVRRLVRPAGNPDGEEEDLLRIVRQVRSDIPAVTHVDYSARVQTVRRVDHPEYYAVIEAFSRLTGCAAVVNTSFNVRGEPIVCTPQDAYRCFMRSEMDLLVLEDCFLEKKNQAPSGEDSWGQEYKLD